MRSSNPIFSRNNEWQGKGGYATFDAHGRGGARSTAPADASASTLEDWYRKPSATPAQSGRMTLDDVVVRTAMLFVVLLVGAAAGFFFVPNLGIAIVAALVAMGLGLWASMSKKVRPGVMFAYAALEGVFVGAISGAYASLYEGIVGQAVVGTLCAFTAMLLAYKFGLIKATARFTKVLLVATLGYLIFGLVNLLLASFTSWTSVYAGGGPLAIGISALGVVLASLFLILDFSYIEQGIRNGLPQKEAWRAGFGLMVTLVWLYLEMLRLIAILRGND
ncbi:Bax inhibitor-1/YccA family protein [Kineococcus gynurae]|uniref:Bax inhibitor-1/YccA family protein n=1 Tax=Kineococcus gynurae TaxID=452979 RepID=A0ABV5LNU0_9ACTN